MVATHPSRQRCVDLLLRPPIDQLAPAPPWPGYFVDRARQLAALAELVDRGLLSEEECERQQARLVEGGP